MKLLKMGMMGAVVGAGILPLACGADDAPRDPGGYDYYGESFIGFKNSAEAQSEGAEAGVNLNGATGAADGDFDSIGAPPSEGQGGAPNDPLLGGYGGAITDFLPRSIRPRLLDVSPPDPVLENAFVAAGEEPTSTFSIDVDSGSYTLSRAALRGGQLPSRDNVRIEEFLNYFHFHYAAPKEDRPLSVYTEWGDCPWNDKRQLLMLGVQGQEVSLKQQPPLNLVYLLDTSGSMHSAERLPLLKRGFAMMTRMLRKQDRVSIVTYAGSDRVLLEGASGADEEEIFQALESLSAGGSTNGAGGIQRAYEIAEKYFIEGGSNRILLATDGDFNVGISEPDELVEFVSEKRKTGVALSVYGYGIANYRDEVAEQLANNGDGIYFYIDGEEETRRAFGHAMSGSLMTVAKDVKLQVEFNPSFVKGYRLIGYENRVLSNSAFSDGSVDAGEMGAGMSVTALYEVIPANSDEALPSPIPGTENPIPSEGNGAESIDAPSKNDFAMVRIAYKPGGDGENQLESFPVKTAASLAQPSFKFLFAAGVSEFAMELLGSQYLSDSRGSALRKQMEKALVLDKEGAVREAVDMLSMAREAGL